MFLLVLIFKLLNSFKMCSVDGPSVVLMLSIATTL